MNQAFQDYFRCPPEFAAFSQYGASANEGTPLPRSPHELQPFIAGALEKCCPREGVVHLCFDAAAAVNALRQESYLQPPRSTPVRRLVRQAYYGIRPVLPVSARKHLQRIALRGWDKIPFPHWPIDATVDIIMRRMMRLVVHARGREPVPFIWFWPEGRRAACILTHDVETASGRDFCPQLMDFAESEGFRSSFQVVPERRYDVPESFRQQIRSRGFELNLHGLNHDGNLFRDRSEFLTRAQRIHHYAKQWGTRGFRSPVLYRNPTWMRELPFEYDMTFPNVGRLDPQRGGCCTVMPYFLHHLIELPLTTTQDYTLFHILRNFSIDLWKQQIQISASHHGLISFNVHPDYLIERRARNVYRHLLGHLRDAAEREYFWCALPGEIASWWRERAQLRLEPGSNGDWQIVGPGAERARVAFARLEGERLVIEVVPAKTLTPVAV